MRPTDTEAPELYWFLGALAAHLLACFALFSAAWLLPEGAPGRAAGAAFDFVARPGPLPVSSLAWGAAVAALAGGWRRLRGAV